MWDGVLQGIFSGLASGWIYILVALGLALVFSILGILQFAHGEIYMFGAYVVYYVNVAAHVPYLLALLIAALVMGVAGIVLERVMFRRIRGEMEPAILAAIGLTLLLQTVAVIAFGTFTKFIPSAFPGVITMGAARLSKDRLFAVIVGVALTLALYLVIKKTKVGKAMLAVSHDPEAAALQGINVNRVSSLSMGIGSALAAVAGGMVGSILQLAPHMGTFAITKGIAVVILGGIGSISGAVLGGLILGLVDGLVSLYSSGTMAAIVGFCVIIVVLLIRPKGLLGQS